MSQDADRSLAAERQLSESLLGKPYEALTPIQKSVVDLVAAEAPSKEHPHIRPIDERTFWPQLLAEFLPRNHLASVRDQKAQDLERLLLQPKPSSLFQ